MPYLTLPQQIVIIIMTSQTFLCLAFVCAVTLRTTIIIAAKRWD